MAKKKLRKQELTPKQVLFAEYFAKYLDEEKAAIKAGYKEKNAKTQAGALLRNPLVKKKIASLSRNAVKKAKLDREEIFTELANIATSNICNYVDDENLEKLPEEQQKAVKKITIKEDFYQGELVGRTTVVELHSKLKAIDTMINMLSLANPEKMRLDRDKFEFDKYMKKEELKLRWQEVEQDKKNEVSKEEQEKMENFK